MAVLHFLLAPYSLKNLVFIPYLKPRKIYQFQAMSSSSSSSPEPAALVHKVPGLDPNEMDRVSDQTFQRYTSSSIKRNGKGVAIVWFRNDLRVLDNEALYKAWLSSREVLPVYCVDPRLFGSTHYFGFPKTGALRAQFLVESLADLKKNITKWGLNLLIQHGKPEEVLSTLAKTYGAHIVYAQKETCSEELSVERAVSKGMRGVVLQSPANTPRLQLIRGTTMYHIDDLPSDASSLPDVYTQFRKSVEAKCTVRSCIKMPASLGPTPTIGDWGCVPSLHQFGLQLQNVVNLGMKFVGGESAALGRINEYFWKKDLLSIYKKTRNGMLGPDYSTKFSPWLASGSLSPRLVHEEVKRYEKERQANDSTYWVLFELIWREYLRFLSVKYGNLLFHSGGPIKLEHRWSQEKTLFESWRDGHTGYPLIDANMKEMSTTDSCQIGEGRSFKYVPFWFEIWELTGAWELNGLRHAFWIMTLVPIMVIGLMEQELEMTPGKIVTSVFQNKYVDYYVASLYTTKTTAQNYDPEGEYVAYWLTQLQSLPKDKRHFPGMAYIKQVVPLKYGNAGKYQNHDKASTARGRNFGGRQTKGSKR